MTNYGIADRQKQIMDSLDDGTPVIEGKAKKAPTAEPVMGAIKQPSYMPGGGPAAEEPTIAVPEGYGKVYDDGGKVNILDKAEDYARNLYAQAKSLMAPLDSEKAAFSEKERAVNDYTQKPAPAAPAATATEPAPWEHVNPLPYGSRPGEKRPEEVLQPLTPTDNIQNAYKTQPKMQPSKVYDEGGEVDLDEDGKKDHQRALLSDGERVLTPEEAKQYEKEHPEVVGDGREGAPVDFGGRVFSQTNPPTKIIDSDNPPSDTDRLPNGVQGNIQNAPMETPKGDISNPPAADIKPEAMRPIVSTSEASGNEPQPYGGEVKQPTYQPGKEPSAEQNVAPPDPNAGMKEMLSKKKADAAMKGDLLGLGAAIIGERAMEPVYGGKPATPGSEVKPGEPVPTGKAAFDQKMAYYNKAYQDALDDFSPEGKERAGNIKDAMLNYEKNHPYGAPESARPGVLGKIEHGLANVGNAVAAVSPVAASVASAIPESKVARNAQEAGAERMAAAGSKEAQEQATTEMTKAETAIKKLGAPKELTGDTNVRTNTATGKRERAYEYLDGTIRWVPEGESPLSQAYYTPPKFDLFSGPKPQVGAVPAPVAPPSAGGTAAAGGTPQYVYGEKPDAEHMPASKAELGSLHAAVVGMPSMTAEQRAALEFPPNYNPTVADVKERLATVEKMQNAQRQASQDKFNDYLRQIMAQNQQLMTQAHLEDEKFKHDKIYADNAANADSAYAGLMSQEVYNDAMNKWYKSPTYAKDVVLITNLINDAKNQSGGFSSLGSDVGLGALVGGPEGALVGGVTGIISQALKGPADAALETLKKQGVSPEGYQVMQAYFNSIPGRLNFETSVMGVKASAMRMREVMRSLMNTVPSPNTPEGTWKNSFNLYYKPMKNLTERKVTNLDLPKGYTKPTRETMGYPSEPQEKLPKPDGATHMSQSNVDGQWYYLDANKKKLGPVYKTGQ